MSLPFSPETLPVPQPPEPATVRNLTLLGISYFPSLITYWMLATLTTLILAKRGVDPAVIGFFAATPWIAVLFTAPFVTRLMQMTGWLGSLQIGNLLAIVAVVGFASNDSLVVWFGIAFLHGVSIAIRWIVVDSWAVSITPQQSQGRMVGAFETLAGLAIGVGPALVAWVGIDGTAPFAVIGLMLTFVLVSCVFARVPSRIWVATPGRSSIQLFVPAMILVVVAVGFGGVLEAGVSGMLPVYGLERGLDVGLATLLVTAANAFALFVQWPLGWCADRFGAERTLRVAACGLVVCGVGFAVVPVGAPLFTAVFLWGGFAGTFYTLGRILVANRYPDAIVPVMSLVASIYTVGAIIGPMAVGFLLSAGGASGFAWGIVASAVVLCVAVLVLVSQELKSAK